MKPFISFLLMVSMATQAATTYYVGPPGNAGSGLSTNPNSPGNAATMLAALTNGNIFIVQNGNWLGPWLTSGTVNNATIRAQNRWMAHVQDGSGYGFALNTPGYSPLVIDGMQFSHTNAGADGVGYNGGGLSISNCWIHGYNWQGVNISGPYDSNNIVQFNLIEGNGATNDNANGPHYHNIYIAGRSNVIQCNVFRNPHNGANVQFYTSYANAISNNVFRNNLTYGSTNFVGLVAWPTDGTQSANGSLLVENNTILDGAQFRYGVVSMTNNIIMASPVDPSEPWYHPVGTLNEDYNVVTNAGFSGGSHDIVTTFAALAFVSYPNGKLWLTSGSSARNVALSTACGLIDFWGNAQSTVADIGAFQFNQALALDPRFLYPSSLQGAYYWLPIETNWVVYASGAGVPNNDGMTQSTPWSIGHALTYGGASNTVVTLAGPATWNSNVTITANSLTVTGLVKWATIITNVTVYHPIQLASGVSFFTLRGLQFNHNQYSVYSGATDYTCSNNVIGDNWCHHTGVGFPPSSSASGIEGQLASHTLVERNLSEWNTGNAGQNHGIYAGNSNNTYRANVCRYNQGGGIDIDSHVSNADYGNLIYNNLLYKNSSVQLVIGPDAETAGTNYVFGNTIVETNAANGYCVDINHIPVDLTNNILVSPSGGFGIINHGTDSVFEDYNIASNHIYYNGSSYVSGPHDIITNYFGFINSASGLYWLGADSPAGGQALATVLGTNDFFGVSQTTVTNMGAFQVGGQWTADPRILDPSSSAPNGLPDYWSRLLPAQIVSGTLIIAPGVTLRMSNGKWSIGNQ